MRCESRTLICGVALISVLASPAKAQLTVFSSGGYSLPETISQAPSGFGSYGGDYFIPDPTQNFSSTTTGTIWMVPQTGGPPTSFQTIQDQILGGTFLPSSFGQYGGDYLITGDTKIYAMNAGGNISVVADATSSGYSQLTTPVVAPSGFGSGAGNVFIGTEIGSGPSGNGGILELSPTGQVSVFNSGSLGIISPFGLAFAPGLTHQDRKAWRPGKARPASVIE
jgi:hypothetical protein